LTGAQGPVGPTGHPGSGIQGASGVPGPTGLPGVSAYEVVTLEGQLALNTPDGSTSVNCPDGKVPISGAFYLTDLAAKNVATKEKNFIVGSYPTATGWTVAWIHGIDNLLLTIRVYAVCGSRRSGFNERSAPLELMSLDAVSVEELMSLVLAVSSSRPPTANSMRSRPPTSR
jgi:hypothetical protein